MDEEKTRAEVAHIEFISYGTSRIFDRRMRSLDWKRKVVTFLGVFVPLMIGCAVLSFGLEAPFLPLCITIAGVASSRCGLWFPDGIAHIVIAWLPLRKIQPFIT